MSVRYVVCNGRGWIPEKYDIPIGLLEDMENYWDDWWDARADGADVWREFCERNDDVVFNKEKKK